MLLGLCVLISDFLEVNNYFYYICGEVFFFEVKKIGFTMRYGEGGEKVLRSCQLRK